MTPSRAVAALLLCAGGLGACVADDPVDPGAVTLRVLLDSCRPGIVNTATATPIDDGLAVTVAHAFDEVDGVRVETADGTTVPAELVHRDDDRDLALLRYDADGLHPDLRQGFTTGDADGLEVGDPGRLVLLRDDRARVVDTEVLRRARVTLDGEGRRLAYEVAADIERGDSGAPLLDVDGRVAGIVFATSRRDEAGWVVAAAELATVEEGSAIPLTCG